jgi:hypothetical protein
MVCSGLPERDFVTRGEIQSWLGIGNSTFDKLVGSGVLKRIVLPGMRYAKFERRAVVKAIGKAES